MFEAEVPGAPGRLPHFYAVASYGLQHVNGMQYTAEVAEDLRATLADARRRAREKFDGPARATRRAGDPDVEWYTGTWPVTVADVLAAGADGYPTRWSAGRARSGRRRTSDGADANTGGAPTDEVTVTKDIPDAFRGAEVVSAPGGTGLLAPPPLP